ncbi:MAG: methylmalonyl-CoA mutase family protein, partial [Actinomycetota bacterium]|nr:methylmalonyl-CoA mutase family protein [Actinomycetota bacterium]
VRAIEGRFMQREIEDSAFRYQREVESGERVIVGVNRHASDEELDMELHSIDDAIVERQTGRLAELRETRDSAAVERALKNLKRAAAGSENLLYPMREALANLATVGEVSDALREVFGQYRPA